MCCTVKTQGFHANTNVNAVFRAFSQVYKNKVNILENVVIGLISSRMRFKAYFVLRVYFYG